MSENPGAQDPQVPASGPSTQASGGDDSMSSDEMASYDRQWDATSEGTAPDADRQTPDAEAGADQPTQTQPVGSGDYVVAQGDCISSIAMDSGHFWETIWNDSDNAELKRVRRNANALLPGDRVTVRPIRPKQEPGGTEVRHRFRRRGSPEKLRIRLLDADDEPRASLGYVLEIDGNTREGTTDAGGWLEEPIAPNARAGKLLIRQTGEEFPLRLGHIDPIDSISGVQARLNNLGFSCGQVDGNFTPQTAAAVRAFQSECGLEATGRLDDETKQRLADKYGC